MSISVETLLGVVAFLLEVGVTIAAIAFFHGSLKQRVDALDERLRDAEDEQKEQSKLTSSVAKLEAELEAVGREIKGLRDDFRRVLEEFARPRYSHNRNG